MAVIFAEQSETGINSWLSTVGDWTASTTRTAGSWSTYSLRGGDSTKATGLWTASASEFWGQIRINWDIDFPDTTLLEFLSPNGTVNVSIGTVNATNSLRVFQSTGTTLATGTTTLSQDRWYYIQFHFTIHDTTGVVDIKLDGVNEINLTGQDTRADAAAGGDTCDRINLHEGQPAWIIYIDDLIINDATDTDNISYPDRLGIEALMPSAAGDVTGLTRGGTDSGANWSQVEERPPNDATDYVFDSVVNDYDLYNIPSTQWTTVAAVLLDLRAQLSDAGGGSIAHMVKYDTDASGTADTENTGADVALSTSWVYHTKYYNRQPDTTSWSAAKVNALQVGAKVR
jgi:hypothetical protein